MIMLHKYLYGTEGENIVKRLMAVLVGLLMLGVVTNSGLAAEKSADKSYKGEITGLFGNEGIGWVNYRFTDKLELNSLYKDEKLSAGIHYKLNDRFGVKLGALYNTDDSEITGDDSAVTPYGGFDWLLPVGNNTRFMGSYDYDYSGKDWQTYEGYILIEMFPKQYVHAGVRGDVGEGAEEFNYDNDSDPDNKEPLFFIRSDFSWQWNKVGLKVRPLLYVQGDYFHDYDLTYKVNDRCNLMFNFNSKYDKDNKYRVGAQFKF
jgi:hypothetical protein